MNETSCCGFPCLLSTSPAAAGRDKGSRNAYIIFQCEVSDLKKYRHYPFGYVATKPLSIKNFCWKKAIQLSHCSNIKYNSCRVSLSIKIFEKDKFYVEPN